MNLYYSFLKFSWQIKILHSYINMMLIFIRNTFDAIIYFHQYDKNLFIHNILNILIFNYLKKSNICINNLSICTYNNNYEIIKSIISFLSIPN